MKTLRQAEHEAAGGRLYSFGELDHALRRRDHGSPLSTEDRRQIAMAGRGQLEMARRYGDTMRADARRVRRELRTHGPQAVAHFYGALAQLDHYRSWGVRFPGLKPRISGQHRRAAGRPAGRTRGSRRHATRAGPSDESGDSDPDGEHHPLAVRETAGAAP